MESLEINTNGYIDSQGSLQMSPFGPVKLCQAICYDNHDTTGGG